jgi:hypothetical protein
MPSVLLRLRAPEWTLEEASKLADDIMATGTLNYTNAEGATVNVEVGDVTVES